MHNDWLYTSWYEHAVGNGSAFLSYVTKYIAYSYISVNTDERYSFLDVTSIKVHKYGFFFSPSFSSENTFFKRRKAARKYFTLPFRNLRIIITIIDRWDVERIN